MANIRLRTQQTKKKNSISYGRPCWNPIRPTVPTRTRKTWWNLSCLFSWAQWAALRTKRLLTSEPPHQNSRPCCPSSEMAAIHGQSPRRATSPPTMRWSDDEPRAAVWPQVRAPPGAAVAGLLGGFVHGVVAFVVLTLPANHNSRRDNNKKPKPARIVSMCVTVVNWYVSLCYTSSDM